MVMDYDYRSVAAQAREIDPDWAKERVKTMFARVLMLALYTESLNVVFMLLRNGRRIDLEPWLTGDAFTLKCGSCEVWFERKGACVTVHRRGFGGMLDPALLVQDLPLDDNVIRDSRPHAQSVIADAIKLLKQSSC
jgi:hypothetical protein